MIAASPDPEKAPHLRRARGVAIAAALAAGLLAAPTAAGNENRHLQLCRAIAERGSFLVDDTLAVHNDAYVVFPRAGPHGALGLLGDIAASHPGPVHKRLASPGLALAAAPVRLVAARALSDVGPVRRDGAIELLLVWFFAAAPLGLGTWALARALERLGLASAADAPDLAGVHAFATLALSYGTLFDPSSLAIALVLCALAAVARGDARASALAGLCAGAAVACEAQALAPLFVVLAVAARRGGARSVAATIAGAAAPLALVALYRVRVFDGSLFPPPALTGGGTANPIDARGSSLGLGSLWDVIVGVPSLHRGWAAFAPVTVLFAAGLVREARGGQNRHVARAALAAIAALIVVHASRRYDWRDLGPGPRGSILALPLLSLGAPAGLSLLRERARRTAISLSIALTLATTQSASSWSLLGSVDELVALGPRSPLLAAATLGVRTDAIAPSSVALGAIALTAAVAAALALARPTGLRGRVLALLLAAPALSSLPYFALCTDNAENQRRELRIREVQRAIRFAANADEARRVVDLARDLNEIPLEADAFAKLGALDPDAGWAIELSRQIREKFREVDGPRRESVRLSGASPPPSSWPAFGVGPPK